MSGPPTREPPPPESIDQKVVLGLRWSVIRQIILTVVGTAGVLTYTRVLGPSGLGLFAIAGIIYGGLLLLIQAPFRDAVVYFRTDDHARAAFFCLAGFGLATGLVIFAAAPGVAAFYETPEAALLIRGMILVFWLRTLAVVPAARLLETFRFDLHEGFLVLSESLFTAVVILALWLNPAVTALIAAHLSAALAFCLLVWWRTEFSPFRPVRPAVVREVLGYAGRLVGSQALKYGNLNIDQAAVGRLGERSLGLYSFGENQSAFLVVGIGVPMGQIAISTLAAVRERPATFRRLLIDLFQLTSFASTPYHLLILTLGPLFVSLFFGPDWLPAVPLLQAYLVFRLLQTLLEVCDGALSAAGRPDIRLRFDLLLLPLFAAGTLLTVTLSGRLVVIAWTLALIRLLVGLLYLSVTLAITGVRWSELGAGLGQMAGAALASSLFLWLLRLWPAWRGLFVFPGRDLLAQAAEFSALVLLGTAVYLVLAWRFDRAGFWTVMRTAARTLLSAGWRQKIKRGLARFEPAPGADA